MESIQRKQFNRYIKNFEFTELFNQLGWNFVDNTFPKKAANQIFEFHQIAEKSGFTILICKPTDDGTVPDSQTRKRIHTEITKLHHEHLIIFIDGDNTTQHWELLVREPNKPTRTVGHKWNKQQDPELLYQKLSGAFFTFEEDEQGDLTIVDVVQRIKENFGANAEKVTKKFYQEFKKQHSLFLDFIEGIDDTLPDKDNSNKQWYASLMLNRLMFCYFIQKKGFLDQDKNYLKNKLNACRKVSGNRNFYGFYRSFLLELFHDGLGKPLAQRNGTPPVDLGNIPYLNGGLFDVHELERQFDEIQIDDDAFKKIFDFFDDWEWHLDTREHAEGKTINPDVIGYIFEKYINERAAMGAYYTKEDITDYIGKNTIIPFLFDETERKLKEAFKPDAEIWQFIKESGDLYIYDAVKYGVPESGDLFNDLPDEVQAGFNPEFVSEIVSETTILQLWEIRKTWNQRAPEDIALPTEIYRELIERRKRYADVKNKIANGEIAGINDFITYNLNIRQFAQDFIETTNNPVFVRHFYKAINKITILDPTCGSGAFLFAAMNILEPLYETCIKRMEEFTEEQPGKHKFFEKTLEIIENEKHPSLKYFIYKSIILHNLYGVDIMKEAVEIAKLRLFLKLVALVDPDPKKQNYGLEPLPDVDFNIRAGNTLVGFATEEELFKTIQKKDGLFAQEKLDDFKEQFVGLNQIYLRFQDAQVTNNQGTDGFRKTKNELQRRLKALNKNLNIYLATNYGIDANLKLKEFSRWLATHQPFNWFAEFYDIINVKGGFDVIIGNPPYIAMGKIEYDLNVTNYKCSDLFGYVIRRCFQILNENSRYGFIVMHNLAFSRNFGDVRKAIKNRAVNAWFSFFARIPAGLFSGDVRVRNCIFILENTVNVTERHFYSTRIHRWFAVARNALFEKLNYADFSFADVIPMFNNNTLSKFFENSKGKFLSHFQLQNSKHKLFFKQSAYNWIAVNTEPAPCFDNKGKEIIQSQVSDVSFIDEDALILSLLMLNGKTFFSQWLTYGDEFHITKDDLRSIKVPYELISDADKKLLKKLAHQFLENIDETIQYKLNAGKNVGTFNTSKLWYLTDQSDKIFLKYLCDNPEEVYDAVENHVFQTVITVSEQDAPDE